MKALIFHIGAERYGLPLAALTRVLPALQLRQLPLTPEFVAGLMDYHGRPVPVIDLAALAGLARQPPCFDTRLLLVDYPGQTGLVHELALLVHQVRGVQEIDPATLADPGVLAAPFLGQVASLDDGMVQLVTLDTLLPAQVREALFQAAQEPA